MRSKAFHPSCTRWCRGCQGGFVPRGAGCHRADGVGLFGRLRWQTEEETAAKGGTDGNKALEMKKAGAMYGVVPRFLYKLREHVVCCAAAGDDWLRGGDMSGTAFVEALDEMHRVLDAAAGTPMGSASSSSSTETEPRSAIVHRTAGTSSI